jgi:tetratricopeptide (TPR) repeat protein
MWNIIGIIFVLAGLALIWSVLVKKFPQLKLIDLSTMAKERHAEVKARIMKARFDRSLGAVAGKTAEVTNKASGRVKGLYEKAYGSLKKMEARMDGGRKPAVRPAQAADVAAGLDEAQKARQEERYEDAERMYIELLKQDAKNADAYRGLAELFIDQKLYDQAAETLEFLLRRPGPGAPRPGRGFARQLPGSRGALPALHRAVRQRHRLPGRPRPGLSGGGGGQEGAGAVPHRPPVRTAPSQVP